MKKAGSCLQATIRKIAVLQRDLARQYNGCEDINLPPEYDKTVTLLVAAQEEAARLPVESTADAIAALQMVTRDLAFHDLQNQRNILRAVTRFLSQGIVWVSVMETVYLWAPKVPMSLPHTGPTWFS